MDHYIQDIILWLQTHASAEILTVGTFAVCGVAILYLLRFYGALGLYVYNVLALVVANIQVLRMTTYTGFSAPVALGTVLYTTTYFVNDLLSEHYGPKAALKCVNLGFWVQILMIVWMVLTLGHPIVIFEGPNAVDSMHEAMMQIFTPSLRLFIASIAAYWVSQSLDVHIFAKVRTVTQGRFLWLRQNASMWVAGFIDNFIFSALAWRWLSETPYSWWEVWVMFILSAQVIRIILNLAATPLMYLSYKCRGYDAIQQPV